MPQAVLKSLAGIGLRLALGRSEARWLKLVLMPISCQAPLLLSVSCPKSAGNHTSAALDHMVWKILSTKIPGFFLQKSQIFSLYSNCSPCPVSHSPQRGSASENSSVKLLASSSFKFFQWFHFCSIALANLSTVWRKCPLLLIFLVCACYFRSHGKFQILLCMNTTINNKIWFSIIWWPYFLNISLFNFNRLCLGMWHLSIVLLLHVCIHICTCNDVQVPRQAKRNARNTINNHN